MTRLGQISLFLALFDSSRSTSTAFAIRRCRVSGRLGSLDRQNMPQPVAIGQTLEEAFGARLTAEGIRKV